MSEEDFTLDTARLESNFAAATIAIPADVERMSLDRASQAVEALKDRIKARANMDVRLAELEATLSQVQRQSMSLSTGADDMERVKNVIRQQSAAINALKSSVTALEGVCKHLVQESQAQQKELATLNQALCRLADD